MPQPERVLREMGEAIRIARTSRGISQEELGLASGVHRNYVGGIERGERSPTVATVAKLAEALGVSIGDFFAPPAG